MDTQLGIEAIKQVPALTVLVWLVCTFLSHIKSSEKSRKELDEKRDAHLETLGTTCHAFQNKMWDEARGLFTATNKALGENTAAFQRTNDTLSRIERQLNERKA